METGGWPLGALCGDRQFCVAVLGAGAMGGFCPSIVFTWHSWQLFLWYGTHELGHGTVFQTKALNKIFLYIFCLLSWWNPFDYAASHTYHHRVTLHPEGDREDLLLLHPNTDKLFLLQLCTINIMTQLGRTFGKGGLISTLRETVLHAFGRFGSTDISSNEWLDSLHKDQLDQHRRAGSMVALFARVSRRGVCSGVGDGPLDPADCSEPLQLHRQLAGPFFGSAAALRFA